MALTSQGAKDVLSNGGNLEVTENAAYTAESVKDMVRIAVAKNVHITVHAARYTQQSLKDMAKIGGPNVTIVA